MKNTSVVALAVLAIVVSGSAVVKGLNREETILEPTQTSIVTVESENREIELAKDRSEAWKYEQQRRENNRIQKLNEETSARLKAARAMEKSKQDTILELQALINSVSAKIQVDPIRKKVQELRNYMVDSGEFGSLHLVSQMDKELDRISEND